MFLFYYFKNRIIYTSLTSVLLAKSLKIIQPSKVSTFAGKSCLTKTIMASFKTFNCFDNLEKQESCKIFKLYKKRTVKPL